MTVRLLVAVTYTIFPGTQCAVMFKGNRYNSLHNRGGIETAC